MPLWASESQEQETKDTEESTQVWPAAQPPRPVAPLAGVPAQAALVRARLRHDVRKGGRRVGALLLERLGEARRGPPQEPLENEKERVDVGAAGEQRHCARAMVGAVVWQVLELLHFAAIRVELALRCLERLNLLPMLPLPVVSRRWRLVLLLLLVAVCVLLR